MPNNASEALVVRMEASLAKFERQMQRGVQVAANTSKGIEDRFTRMNDRVSQSSQRAAQGMRAVFSGSRQGNFVLQNTAAQFGDIAVQIGGGTSAMRAMGQQLPQILGGFAALGGAVGVLAPLLGTVAAVGFPLAAFFLSTGDEAEKAGDKVETFAQKLDAAEGAIKRAQEAAKTATEGGLEDLRAIYGHLTDDVIALADALAEIEKRAVKVEVGELVKGIAGFDQAREILDAQKAFADLQKAFAGVPLPGASVDALRPALQAFEDFREELGLSEADAQRLIVKLEQASYAFNDENFVAAAEHMGEVRELAEELGLIMAESGTAAYDFWTNVVGAESTLRQMIVPVSIVKGQIEETSGAQGGVTDAVGETIAAVGILIARLEAALGVLSRVSSGVARLAQTRLPDFSGVAGAASSIWSSMVGAAFGSDSAPTTSPRPQAAPNDPDFGLPPAPTGGGSRGGGGGGKSYSPQDVIDTAKQEIALLEHKISLIGLEGQALATAEAKYKLIEEAKRRNLDLDQRSADGSRTLREEIDAQAEAIGNLTVQYEAAQERAQAYHEANDDLRDSILDVAVGTADLAGELSDLAKQIARTALEAAFYNTGPMASGSGSGLLGGLVDTLAGALFPSAPSVPTVNTSSIAAVGKTAAQAITLNINSDPSVIVSVAEATAETKIKQNNAVRDRAFNGKARAAVTNTRKV